MIENRSCRPARAYLWRFTVICLTFTALIGRTAVAHAAVACSRTAIQAIAPSGIIVSSAAIAQISQSSPSFCAVTGVTAAVEGDFITFDLDLPTQWNGRFAFFGNGGFAGWMQAVGGLDFNDALNEGFATAATDTGHQTNPETDPLKSFDARWALNNPTAVDDFDFAAVHEVTVAAKAIIGSFYGNDTFNSYFEGCSTGGRQGLVEAQLFPADFDGIVEGDPAIGAPFTGMNWNQQAILKDADSYITNQAVTLVDAAVTAECDGLDGVVDGLIQDPRLCKFEPASLECGTRGNTAPNCLTAGQVTAFDAIYQGAQDSNGNQLYPGYMKSNPAGGWEGWITGCATNSGTCIPPKLGVAEPWGNNSDPTNNGAPTSWTAQDQYLKFFVFNRANFDSLTFNFGTTDTEDVDDAVNLNGSGVMATQLTQFAAQGHKLMMYHGWSDPALSPLVSVNYFNAATAQLGSSASNSVRLFMVPGMQHCQGTGPGPNVFGQLAPLVSWVENDVAPDNLIAEHFTNDVRTSPIDRSMPLCSFPEEAHYSGKGNVDQAGNWSCQ